MQETEGQDTTKTIEERLNNLEEIVNDLGKIVDKKCYQLHRHCQAVWERIEKLEACSPLVNNAIIPVPESNSTFISSHIASQKIKQEEPYVAFNELEAKNLSCFLHACLENKLKRSSSIPLEHFHNNDYKVFLKTICIKGAAYNNK